MSVSLLQVFSQWQQGALQQLKHTINTLTQKSERAKVTAAPTQSDDESGDETQVRLTCHKMQSCDWSVLVVDGEMLVNKVIIIILHSFRP